MENQIASFGKLKANSVKSLHELFRYQNSFPDFLARKKISNFQIQNYFRSKNSRLPKTRIFAKKHNKKQWKNQTLQ